MLFRSKFVRRHEIILSQALTVRDNETDLKQFIEELYLAGASAVVFAFPGNDFHMLDNILPIYSAKNFFVILINSSICILPFLSLWYM